MNGRTSRRQFLKSTVAAAGVSLLGPPVLRAQSPNGRLQLAAVAVGGMGWTTLSSIAAHPNVDVVALCDVDENNLNKAAKTFPKARKYFDWREMLAKEEKAIEAVSVATPDHMHAPIAMTAMHMGKHVYCQKPMTHDVFEARQMMLTARKAGLVTQLGNQFSSGIGDRMTVQMIREGTIGKVKEAYGWSNRHGVAQYRLRGPRPAKEDPAPPGLKWDLWLGTAPVRPYANTVMVEGKELSVYHPTRWRAWQDFGTGWGGDIGCHIFSAVFLALGLTAPTSISAQVEPEWAADPARRGDLWPTWQIITYEFPGTDRTAGKTAKITWLDGEKWPSEEVHALFENCKWPEECAIFIGEKGNLLMPHTSGPQFFPAQKYKGVKRPKLPAIDHYQSWAEACLSRQPKQPISNFDVAGPLSEAVLLGTVAARCPGQTLQWDSANLTFANSDQANQLLRRRYRDGWTVAGL